MVQAEFRGDIYTVYTQAEADAAKIPYVGWKEASTGDWCLSDDGIVCEAVRVQIFGRVRYVETPMGKKMYNDRYPGTKFNMLGRRVMNDKPLISVAKAKGYEDKLRGLAHVFSKTWNRHTAMDILLPDIDKTEKVRYFRAMKTEEFKNMVNEELEGLLDEYGFSERDVIQLLKDVVDMAKTKKDVSTLRGLVGDLMDLHGMRDKKKVKSTLTLTGTRQQMIADMKQEELKITGKQEVTQSLPDARN